MNQNDFSSQPTSLKRNSIEPMTLFRAAVWAFAANLLHMLLIGITVSIHSSAGDDIISAVICQGIAYLLILFFILRVHAPEMSIREFIGFRKTHWGFFPLALVLSVAAQTPINTLYELILKRFPIPPEAMNQLSVQFATSTMPKKIFIATSIVLLGPIIEELIFRGALFKGLKQKQPFFQVLLITSLLFAVAHPQAQIYIPITLVGLCLAFLRWFSGSIMPSIVFHIGFNALPLLAMFFNKPEESATINWKELLPLLGGSVVVAVISIVSIYFLGTRNKLALSTQEKDL